MDSFKRVRLGVVPIPPPPRMTEDPNENVLSLMYFDNMSWPSVVGGWPVI